MPVPSDAAFATIGELGAGLRNREYTAVELAEFTLDRAEQIGPRFNAVVTVTRERALREAAAADDAFRRGRDLGPLHGIPYGVKDLLSTEGYPTTWGAAPFRDQQIDADATVVQKLTAAGAVLAAKLSMVEIAGGLGYQQANASFTGPGLNPWSPDRWSGGSSSGPGSAVSAGIVPFAIGSETWGSILTPAAYCGITGLRPTYGRVSRQGAMALSWTMDKLGPMARSAEDCETVLEAIAGFDPADDSSVDRNYAPARREENRPWRIATLQGAIERVQPEVAENFRRSVDVFRSLASVEEAPFPSELPANAVADVIISCEGAAAFESLVADGRIEQMTAEEDRWRIWPDLMIPATDYIRALRVRRLLQKQLAEFFSGFDAILAPSLNTVAGPIDQPFHVWSSGFSSTPLSGASNAAGLPAVCLPNGFGADGLPTALQLVGGAYTEDRLLLIGREYQARTDWHRRHPEMTP
ncbi:MAG: amidase [Planctomycetaceae bacterium]|nr:amidase [Planctomycetaceae bacterium]